MSAPYQSQDPPAFNSHEVMQFYIAGKHDQVSDQFSVVLEHFQATTYYSFTTALQNYLNGFVGARSCTF